ncbi:MAG: LysR family transcriptional regulator [Actinomycetota bacterium]|nr:LysR family transcriptional regulator [Actinomycetota bacterium]
MDYSLLRTCLAVYRTGSLTKAARQLGISQPAVTGQIRALEETLGQPLFRREPKGTVPTAAAHELIRDTGAALDSLDLVMRRRLLPAQLPDRAIHVAGPAEILVSRALPALAGLVSDGLRLRITFGLTPDLLLELAEGTYDLVIATTRNRNPAIVLTPLMDEEFVLVGDSGWARDISAADIAERGARALDDARLIAYSDSLPIIRRYWTTVFGEDPTAAPTVTVPDLRAVLAAVKAGAGISVLPTYLCSAEIANGEIEVLHQPEVAPLNTLFLATKAGAADTVGLAAVRSHLLLTARGWR